MSGVGVAESCEAACDLPPKRAPAIATAHVCHGVAARRELRAPT